MKYSYWVSTLLEVDFLNNDVTLKQRFIKPAKGEMSESTKEKNKAKRDAKNKKTKMSGVREI